MSPSPVSPVDAASLPADIRRGPAERRDAYTSALAFEQVLTTQLAEAMLPEQGGSYAQLLPQALADGLAAAGGLGLARPLTDAVAPAAPAPDELAPAATAPAAGAAALAALRTEPRP